MEGGNDSRGKKAAAPRCSKRTLWIRFDESEEKDDAQREEDKERERDAVKDADGKGKEQISEGSDGTFFAKTSKEVHDDRSNGFDIFPALGQDFTRAKGDIG